MSSKQEVVDEIVEYMALAGEVRSRKMFGEYAIYCNDKVVALVSDDTLFIKHTAAGSAFIQSTGKHVVEAPAYPGAKNSFLISEENWKNKTWLTELVRVTEKGLPKPLPKKKKKLG